MLRNNRKGGQSMWWPPTKSSEVEIENQSQLVRVFFIAAKRAIGVLYRSEWHVPRGAGF
jgi:hypothetical protein